MSVKNILVAYNGNDAADAALRYAASMASKYDAHVTGLLAHSAAEHYASANRWIPSDARKIIEKSHTEGLDRIESRFRELAPTLNLGDRIHWLREKGRVDAVVADCGRGFDLILMGRFGDEDGHVAVHPDKVAMQSGRPVLIVPGRYSESANHRHVVIAWDSGRAAARALSDAMQILEDAALVTILTVGEHALSRPASELENHLQRHGARAEHVHLDTSKSVEETILDFCADRQPGLLVMGAYEHSKFREDLFGGVTASVIRECPLPVLMSH